MSSLPKSASLNLPKRPHPVILPGHTIQWKCDICGKEIATPEAGYVWWTEEEGRISEPTLSHGQGFCEPPFLWQKEPLSPKAWSLTSRIPLQYLIGYDGLARLLALLRRPGLPLDAWCKLIERIQVPGLESVRLKSMMALGMGKMKMPPEGFVMTQEIIHELEGLPSRKTKRWKELPILESPEFVTKPKAKR